MPQAGTGPADSFLSHTNINVADISNAGICLAAGNFHTSCIARVYDELEELAFSLQRGDI
jgi:hypothetical protein